MPLIHRPLTDGAPLVSVLIGVSAPRRQALIASGLAVPDPVVMHLLIDTGASCVSLDQTAIAPLGLAPTGRATVHTPSTDAAAPHFCNQYDVSLILPAPRGRRWCWKRCRSWKGRSATKGLTGFWGEMSWVCAHWSITRLLEAIRSRIEPGPHAARKPDRMKAI